MKKIISIIFDVIFPLKRFLSYNKKINKRIKAIENGDYTNNFKFIDDYEKYNYEDILPFYDESIKTRKEIEDKAKISVIGVTISITIIVGISAFILKFNFSAWNWIETILIIVVCLVIIAYINIAGILALLMLGNKNKVHSLDIHETKLDKNEKAKKLAIYTEQNTNLNTIRNNYVYTSYIHLIYSILLFSIFSIVASFRVSTIEQNKENYLMKNSDNNVKELISNDSLDNKSKNINDTLYYHNGN